MKIGSGIIVIIVVVALTGTFLAVYFHGLMIQQEQNAQLVDHLHVRVIFLSEGDQFSPPAGIGIKPDYWVDRSLDQYGIGGISPIHTHDDDFIMHIEANIHRNWTLGEFFDIWGIEAGGPVTSDDIPLADYKTHVLVNGETIKVQREDNFSWSP